MRFNIRDLLIFMAAVGVGCVALVNSTQAWAAGMMAAVVVSLVAAVLLAVFTHGAKRGYWTGFAVSGWVYLLLCIYGFASGPSVSVNPRNSFHNTDPLGRENLITAQISSFVYQKLVAESRQALIAQRRAPGTLVQVIAGMDRDHFIVVSHALWAWLLAACGGLFACWILASPASKT